MLGTGQTTLCRPPTHARTVARTCARTHARGDAETPCTHAHKHVHMVRVAYTHVHAPLCAQMYGRHAAWRSARSLSPDRACRVGMCMTGTTRTWSSCQGASAPAPAAVFQHARAHARMRKQTNKRAHGAARLLRAPAHTLTPFPAQVGPTTRTPPVGMRALATKRTPFRARQASARER